MLVSRNVTSRLLELTRLQVASQLITPVVRVLWVGSTVATVEGYDECLTNLGQKLVPLFLGRGCGC